MPSRHHLSRKEQNALFAERRLKAEDTRRKNKAIRMRKLTAKTAVTVK